MHHIYYRKSLAFCEVSFLWFFQIHQRDFFGESTKYTNYIWGPYFCFKANLHKIEDFANRKWFTASLFWKCIFSISLINKAMAHLNFMLTYSFRFLTTVNQSQDSSKVAFLDSVMKYDTKHQRTQNISNSCSVIEHSVFTKYYEIYNT